MTRKSPRYNINVELECCRRDHPCTSPALPAQMAQRPHRAGLSAMTLATAVLLAILGFVAGDMQYHNYLEKFPSGLLPLEKEHDVSIHYNATSLQHSGDWVEVSVQGVARPHRDDILALYAPADAHLHGAAPVKYEYVRADARYLKHGHATLSLRLINLRVDMRFVLVRGGDGGTPKLVGEGPVLPNANPNELTGIHLMPGHRPVDMLVQWTTRDVGEPFVRFGTAPDDLRFAIPATTETYSRREMCGAPASGAGWLDPGALHTAVMAGLTPDTRYYYVVGDAQGAPHERTSAPRSFLSHPGVGPHLSVSVLGVADQGVGEPDGALAAMEYQPALAVAARMLADARAGHAGFGAEGGGDADGRAPRRQPYRMVLHNGDISYARGYGALWDTFLFQQRAVLEAMPAATSIANHERDWPGQAFYRTSDDSGGECGVPYYKRFPMPRPNLAPDQAFYSFDFGPAHFAVMSSEHDYTAGSPQHLWLAGDLAAVDRERTPWLILMGHRPLYIDANDFYWPTGKQTTAIQLQTALEYLLREHAVDLVLAGHHHSYQRTCAVHKGRCMKHSHGHHRSHHGTVHVCFGHGGADLTPNGFDETPTWIDYENMEVHGHIRLHMNGTHLHMQALESAGGTVFDELWLTQPQKKHKHRAGAEGLQAAEQAARTSGRADARVAAA
ncbi:hypothetical protein ACKKBG_A01170 [Auxenochlorella protothecoides x Auxenochlorella symbiontica]